MSTVASEVWAMKVNLSKKQSAGCFLPVDSLGASLCPPIQLWAHRCSRDGTQPSASPSENAFVS